MTRFKLCPCCGKKNPPTLLECEQCETDLTAVRAVDEEQEAPEPVCEPPRKSERVCAECGFRNPAAARKCANCGEDISYITPTGICGAARYMLTSDGFEFEITKPLTVIGREAELSDRLECKSYVGRKQAKLTLTEDGLFIANLGQTNGTYVNNERLGEAPRKLADSDEIGLGGNSANGRQELAAYFTVKIKP